MTLIRNMMATFMAFVVLGMAAPANAKTNLETVACRDAGFATLPFTGTATEKETFAKNLPIGTEVLVDGVTVPLASGESLWSRCKTGPSALEIANARVSALETENARLNGIAYHNVAVGSGRKARVTWESTATARGTALEAANATIAKDAVTLTAARNGDIWQNLGLALLLMGVFFACFRKTAARARPVPAGEPTGIDRVESDDRATYTAGQP